jgi:hypothetical protein
MSQQISLKGAEQRAFRITYNDGLWDIFLGCYFLMFSIIFGMLLLMGFSLAAYFLDFNRLYIYGLLVSLSPLVGEWLWSRGYAAHHGFPITFGASAGIMILVGLTIFVRLLRDNPVPTEGIPSEKA